MLFSLSSGSRYRLAAPAAVGLRAKTWWIAKDSKVDFLSSGLRFGLQLVMSALTVDGLIA